MAKSKTKKVVDEEPLDEETAEPEAELDADDIDADDAAADDAADVEDAEGDDEGGDEDEGDAVAETPPKPKLTITTIALILLNWIAVPAFLILALADYKARLDYSYRAAFNYTEIWGLPLNEEDEFPSLANETRPVMRLTPEQLNSAFKSRKGVVPLGGKDTFQPVEEPVPLSLRPKDMTEAFLEDLYGSSVPEAERFKTLEAAIEYLRDKVPADIAQAARDVRTAFDKKKDDEKRKFVKDYLFIMTWDTGEAKKAEDQIAGAEGKDLDDLVKRALVQKILYPLAADIWIVDKVDIALAKAKGPELDALVDEAVQRRLYYDILAPVNLFRPGDLKVTEVERIADREKVTIERLKKLLEDRFSAAVADKYNLEFQIGKDAWGNPQERDSVEKRQNVAFILFTLAHVHVPVLDKKLYAKGIERAQVVSGLYEFTNASIAYVQTLRTLEQRMIARTIARREGEVFGADKKEMSTNGVIHEHADQVQRLHRIVEYVDSTQKRLDDLKRQRDQAKKLYDQRVAQHKDITDKLIKARQGTEKYAKELRGYQDRLHEALLELSDAADTNFRLEAEIRALELSYYKSPPKKGGRKTP